MELTIDKDKDYIIARCAAKHIKSRLALHPQDNSQLEHSAGFIQAISTVDGNLFRAMIWPHSRLIMQQEGYAKRFGQIMFDEQMQFAEGNVFDYWSTFTDAFSWGNGFDLCTILYEYNL